MRTKIIGHERFYVITTANELRTFCRMANEDKNTVRRYNGLLSANIDFNPGLNPKSETDRARCRSWTPIGNEDRTYKGTFDGNGYTISGLFIDEEDKNYLGLFGYIENDTTIRGVTVDGYIRGGWYIGGVVGNSLSRIKDCVNKTEVIGRDNVGGICGSCCGILSGCTNKGNIAGDKLVGGVCGNIVRGDLTSCINEGTVVGNIQIGGVCGVMRGTLLGCANKGIVKGDCWSGGIVGCNSGEVSDCSNEGSVTGHEYTGGISGSAIGTISDCQNKGIIRGDKVTGTITGLVEEKASVTNCLDLSSSQISVTGKIKEGAKFVPVASDAAQQPQHFPEMER